ncbi:MAG: hypothetical protein ACRENQ_05930 [Gemmatimonadaceae bacterium]
MRRFAFALALLGIPVAAVAQQHDTTLNRRTLPRDVVREAVRLYNASGTLRATGRLDIGAGRVINGDVAVLDGPLTIAGHVTGAVLAINGDVTLAPTARLDGDLLVVGGMVHGQNRAFVGGEIRIYRDPLHYTHQGDRISADENESDGEAWWRRFEPRHTTSGSKIQVASAGAYNRVEGLPINLGPQIFRDFDGWSARLDAYAVLRTASSFRAGDHDVGNNLHGEIRLGTGHGVLIGAGAYDVVSPVESWQLSNLETGLAAALFRRGYRDYFGRHGGTIEAGLFTGDKTTFTVSYADEHWSPRIDHNAWTLFRSNVPWRPNPALDDAHFHLVNATLHIDTRSDEENPWAGWYVLADLEHGSGRYGALGPTSLPRTYPAGRPSHYDRGFFDVRRYNRVSRHSQINLRLVTGGWLGGDPLPLERRLSVDGYGALPGFEFRGPRGGEDVGACATGFAPVGYPAQCDRIALAQAEFRSDLHVHLFDWDTEDWIRPHLNADGAWVLFVDAGRGWMVGNSAAPITYASGSLPSFSSFRTDIGVGLDFNSVGVYLAKALSATGQPAQVFIRLQHRF